MSFEITGVAALEILDSRGRPTLQTTITLADGTIAVAGVPSGASTGTREAVELRDGDTARFGGGGVLTAVLNRRLIPINARREALLDALPADATPLQIVHATVAP